MEFRQPERTLVYDVANILFRVSAVQKNNPYAKDSSSDDLIGLCMHISLASIYKWYTKYRPDFVVFAFEGGNNWRKKYTQSKSSRSQYKANRVYDPEMQHFYDLMESFRKTMRNHTSICCLSVDGLEGDDVIAGYAQLYASPEHEIIIVSGDKDFTQLLRLPNVKLINPDDGKMRNQPTSKDYEPDLDYWIFLKCIRGDGGDNVPSAYPKVRETKIKKAYEDTYERINFMNTQWVEKPVSIVDGVVVESAPVTHRVGDLFEQNEILLDLFKQPPEIRKLIEESVTEQVANIGTYSHFHFLRFAEEYKLQRIREDSTRFIELFSNNQKFRKGQQVAPVKPVVEDPPKEPTQSKLLGF